MYLIGIDGGSQSTKVVVYDLDGRAVCEGRQPLRPMRMPAPGVVEHPDDDLWDSLAGASRQAMQRFPGDPAEILAVGLCTIRFCRAMLRADGSLAACDAGKGGAVAGGAAVPGDPQRRGRGAVAGRGIVADE